MHSIGADPGWSLGLAKMLCCYYFLNFAGCEMAKSIGIELQTSDIPLLEECCKVYHAGLTGDSKPILEVMRSTRAVATRSNSDAMFVEAMTIIGRIVSSQVLPPSERRRINTTHDGIVRKLRSGCHQFDHHEARFLSDATELSLRFGMCQYDRLTDCLPGCGFKTLSHHPDWSKIRELNFGGLGIQNEAHPDSLRQIYKLRESFRSLCNRFTQDGYSL